MVGGEGGGHHLADGDLVVVRHDGALLDGAYRQHRRLRGLDYRHETGYAQHPHVGYGECAAGVFRGAERAALGALRQVFARARYLFQRHAVRAHYGGHYQALAHRHGDADVDAVVHAYAAVFVVGVELREAPERYHARGDYHVVDRDANAVRRQRLVYLRAERHRRRHVHVRVDVEVRLFALGAYRDARYLLPRPRKREQPVIIVSRDGFGRVFLVRGVRRRFDFGLLVGFADVGNGYDYLAGHRGFRLFLVVRFIILIVRHRDGYLDRDRHFALIVGRGDGYRDGGGFAFFLRLGGGFGFFVGSLRFFVGRRFRDGFFPVVRFIRRVLDRLRLRFGRGFRLVHRVRDRFGGFFFRDGFFGGFLRFRRGLGGGFFGGRFGRGFFFDFDGGGVRFRRAQGGDGGGDVFSDDSAAGAGAGNVGEIHAGVPRHLAGYRRGEYAPGGRRRLDGGGAGGLRLDVDRRRLGRRAQRYRRADFFAQARAFGGGGFRRGSVRGGFSLDDGFGIRLRRGGRRRRRLADERYRLPHRNRRAFGDEYPLQNPARV